MAELETTLQGTDRSRLEPLYKSEAISPSLLQCALVLKQAASQVNEVVHALGILLSLPYILRNGEVVQALSLAAGNTGRPFDLETDLRIAHFKFIDWKGGPESIRQNQLFKDFYSLAELQTPKERYLYVVGIEHPEKFFAGGRALRSVMSRNNKLWTEFVKQYGERFATVRDYYRFRQASVKMVDLSKIVPCFPTGLVSDEE